jgi:UDPglucose 6-dehydrogenase/GDP-mannose 6-dehydrogenase
LQALKTLGRERGLAMPMLQAILDTNQRQPSQVIRLLQARFNPLEGKKVLLLGLAFKPGTDDVRESASLKILRELAELKCDITAHDPVAGANARKDLPDVPFALVTDWKGRLADVDAVIVGTKWPEYADLADAGLAGVLAGKTIVDPRRMFQPADFKGAAYLSIGRREL